jgi:hypothetical protein
MQVNSKTICYTVKVPSPGRIRILIRVPLLKVNVPAKADLPGIPVRFTKAILPTAFCRGRVITPG